MSSTEHTDHPSSHTHGLDPECPRCHQHADDPTGLDSENLTRIWRGDHHTSLDLAAFNTLYRAVVLTQRLGEAVAYRKFEPGVHSITTFVPDEKPDQYALFKFGGRA